MAVSFEQLHALVNTLVLALGEDLDLETVVSDPVTFRKGVTP
jgi:hypothetical protein